MTIANVQFGANTIANRVSVLSAPQNAGQRGCAQPTGRSQELHDCTLSCYSVYPMCNNSEAGEVHKKRRDANPHRRGTGTGSVLVSRSHSDESPSGPGDVDNGMRQPKKPDNVSVIFFQKCLMGVWFKSLMKRPFWPFFVQYNELYGEFYNEWFVSLHF